MIRLAIVLSLSFVLACGGSQPVAQEPVAATPPSEPPPQPPKEIQPREVVQSPEPIAEGPQPEELEGDEYDEEYGIAGGIEGGVVGGLMGGVPAGTIGGGFGGPPPPPPPPPPNEPQVVPQVALRALRIAGDRDIFPPDAVRLAMKRANQTRVVTALKMCLSAKGSVDRVAVLKSSGHAAYDQLLKTTIERTWRYNPFMVHGRPTPVCTSVTFIYNQKNDVDEPGV